MNDLAKAGKVWAIRKKIEALNKLIARARAKRDRYLRRLEKHAS